MAYTTLVAGTTITAAWANASVRDQSVSPFASAAARSSAVTSPVEGMVSHLNDTNSLGVYSGAVWSTVGPVHGALTSWTPTVTQSVSVTVTNTYSRYQRVGRLIVGWFNLSCTSAGTGSNPILISTPVTVATANQPVGGSDLFDASPGNSFAGTLETDSTSTFAMRYGTGSDNRLGVSAFTAALASGDVLRGSFSVEAAADA